MPECSAATSAWVRGRKTGVVSAAVYAVLGKCRSIARQLRAAAGHDRAGNDLKAQAIRSRVQRQGVSGYVTQAERNARAKDLRAQRAQKIAAAPRPEPAPPAAPEPSPKKAAKPRVSKAKAAAIQAEKERQENADRKHREWQKIQAARPKPDGKAIAAKAFVGRSRATVATTAATRDVLKSAHAASTASPSGRVVLDDLRKRHPGLTDDQFNRILLRAAARGEVSLFSADHPAERKGYAIPTGLGNQRHFLYGGRTRSSGAEKRFNLQTRGPKPKPAPAAPEKPDPSDGPRFALRQFKNKGEKKAENAGAGKTKFMFDMKKGDKPGQTSIMDRVESLPTHSRAVDPFAAVRAARLRDAEQRRLNVPQRRYDLERARATRRDRREDAARPKLVGSEKQVEWAQDVRRKYAISAKRELKEILDKPDLAQSVKDEAVAAHADVMASTSANWWIDNRNRDARNVILNRLRENRKSKDGPENPTKSVGRLSGRAPSSVEAAPVPKRETNPRKLIADNRSRTAAKLKTFRASELEQKHPERFGKVGKTYDVATDKIKFDPDRFQYKMGAQGSHGVTSALGDVKKYDPELAGTISVWRDPKDGRTYVVNGHHRLDLANKLGVGSVSARFIEAADAKEARAKGALVNIAEGRGSALDAAKYFRDSGIDAESLRSKGVSLREHTAAQGLAMAGLSTGGFQRVVDGGLSHNRAAIVGGSGLSHAQQDQLLSVLDKPKYSRVTDGAVRNMAEAAKSAGSRTKTTRDLFGSNDEEEALFVHRARVEDKIGRDLAADKRLFGLVSKSKAAEKLAERGRSTIDVGETGKVSHESAAVLGAFNQLKNRHPKVSRILNHAAEQIADGRPEAEVVRETRTKVAHAVKAILESDDPFSDD